MCIYVCMCVPMRVCICVHACSCKCMHDSESVCLCIMPHQYRLMKVPLFSPPLPFYLPSLPFFFSLFLPLIKGGEGLERWLSN